MHKQHLQAVRDHLAMLPAASIGMTDKVKNTGQQLSLVLIVTNLVIDRWIRDGAVLPIPSAASYLGLTESEAQRLFLMHPEAVAGGEWATFVQAGRAKRAIFDDYHDPVRKGMILWHFDHMIATGAIDWQAAKAAFDIEVAA